MNRKKRERRKQFGGEGDLYSDSRLTGQTFQQKKDKLPKIDLGPRIRSIVKDEDENSFGIGGRGGARHDNRISLIIKVSLPALNLLHVCMANRFVGLLLLFLCCWLA